VIKGGNIFTYMIADKLGVSDEIALRVQNQMDFMNYVDWSEATEEEIQVYAMLAFQDLNIDVPVDF
jgi:hypothetical protein